MSDVLFDTGKYSLSWVQEKSSQVTGTLLAHATLNIEVGGYSDNVGSDTIGLR
jgi:outer membrane protein OmpA-like peptidoglycan-associated protein